MLKKLCIFACFYILQYSVDLRFAFKKNKKTYTMKKILSLCVLVIFFAFLCKDNVMAQDSKLVTTTGNSTYKPDKGCRITKIEVWGAGGGGGRGKSSDKAGSGGGGGGYAAVNVTDAQIPYGSTVNVTVGSGGSNTSSNKSSGGNGGQTYVQFGNYKVTATGGQGGSYSTSGGTSGGGQGGSYSLAGWSSYDAKGTGGTGGGGLKSSVWYYPGGGGGAAGTTNGSNGGSGSSSSNTGGNAGAGNPNTGTGGSANRTGTANSGSNYGGGGGSTTSGTSGAGAQGCARFTLAYIDVQFTLNTQGGGTVTPTSITVKYNSKFSNLPTPTGNTNYYFLGWNTKSDGTGNAITTTTTNTYDVNMTLYAQWLYVGEIKTVSTSGTPCSNFTAENKVAASTIGCNGALPTYSWKCNGNTIPGATSAALSQDNYTLVPAQNPYVFTRYATYGDVTKQSAGSYTISVTYDAGSITQGSATKVPGDNLSVNGSAVSNAEYQWYCNDNPIQGATSQNLTTNAPSTEGNYVYTRKAKLNGCSMDYQASANTYTLTVVPVSPGEITSGTSHICKAGSFTIESVTDASIDPQATITYKWTKNGTDIPNSNVKSLNQNDVDLANLSYGVYVFKRYAKAGTGDWKEATGSYTLNVIELPASWAAPAATYDQLCVGGENTFPSGDWTLTNVSDPVAKMATQFQWKNSYNNGAWTDAGQSDNLVMQFNNAGSYRVMVDLQYFNQVNCVVSTGIKEITIVADPTTLAVPTLSKASICPSEEITLTSYDPQNGGLGDANSYTHYWDININNGGWQRISSNEATYLNATLEGQTYTGKVINAKDFTQTGTLQYRSYVSNEFGCDATSQEVNLTVATVPTAIIAGDTTVCVKEGEDICFKAETTSSQYELVWFDGSTESANVPCVDRTNEIVKTVEVAQQQISGTCQSAKLPQTITVSYSADLDYVTASADTTQSLCQNETIETVAGGIKFSYSGDCEPTCQFDPRVPAGVTVNNDANNKLLVISGAPTEAGTFKYKVYLDPQMGECVSPNSFTGTLTVHPVYENILVSASICPGESYTIRDTKGHQYSFSTTGIHTKTLESVHGCDSTVIVDLYVKEWNQFGFEENESLIAGWTNFSSVSSPIIADAGISKNSSNISYSGWNGSNEVKDNLSSTSALITTSGSSLGLINGTYSSCTKYMNNDKSIVIKTSTKDYSDIKFHLDYGIERVDAGNNDHGFSLFSFAYSTDGINYTNCDSKSITLESGTRVDGSCEIDLSQKSSKAVDNKPEVFIRITFTGAAKSDFMCISAFTKYSLLDNIVFSGKKAVDELEISSESATVCTNQGISLATNAPYTNTDVTPAVTTPVNYKWERIVNGNSTVLESTDYYVTDVDNIPEGNYQYVVSVGENDCVISDTLNVIGVKPAYRLDIVKHAHVCANEVDQISNYVFEDMTYVEGMHIVTPTVEELRTPGVHNCELSVPTTTNPCDSVITLALTVNKAFDTTVVAYICLGETYTDFGFNITPTEEGVTYHTSPDSWKCSTGCDSVYRLSLITNSVMQVLTSDNNVTLAAWNMDNGTNNFKATCGVRTENSKFSVINNSEFSNVSGHAPSADYCFGTGVNNGALKWANLACNCSGFLNDPVPTMFDGVYFEIQLNPKDYNNFKLKFDYKRDNASTDNAQAFNQVNYSYKFAADDNYISLGSQNITNTDWTSNQYDLSAIGDATMNKDVMFVKIEFTGGDKGGTSDCGTLNGSKYLPSYITIDNLMIVADRPAMGQLNGNAQTCSALEICEGQDVIFTRDANASGFDFFLVNEATGLDSAFAANTSMTIKPTVNGTYAIKAVDQLVGCDSTWKYNITIRKAPSIEYVRGTNDDGICGLGNFDIALSVKDAQSYSFTWQTTGQQCPSGIVENDDQQGNIDITGRLETETSARYIVVANPFSVCGSNLLTQHGTISIRKMPELYRIEGGQQFYPVLDSVCQDYPMQYYVDTTGLKFGESTLDQAIIWKNINNVQIGSGDTLNYNADEALHSMKQYVTVIQTGCTTMDTFDLVVYDFVGDTISAPEVNYELNYSEFSLPASLLVPPVVIHNGESMPQAFVDVIQWNQTSNDWEHLTPEQINPSVITTPSPTNLTTYVWWRIKDKCGNWHYTNNGVPQTVNLALPPCGTYTGLSGETLYAVDVDGNVYESVSVGWECWTKTNIKARHYSADQQYFAQGDSIQGAMVYSSDNSDTLDNMNKYGCLYTWYSAVGLPEGTADSVTIPLNDMGHVQGICPKGWYLPTTASYQAILGIAADQLRSTNNWMTNPGTNTTGLSVQPGGLYNAEYNRYSDLSSTAYFWTCEPATYNTSLVRSYMCDCFCYMIREVLNSKTSGLSVRCIKERELSAPKYRSLVVTDGHTKATATAEFYAGGTAITNYQFMIANNQQMNNAQSFNTNSPTYTFNNLLPGYSYFVKVIATNEIGSTESVVVKVDLTSPY